MNMYNKLRFFIIIFASLATLSSCESELELTPEDDRKGAEEIFQQEQAYKQFLAKLYAGLAISGQEGPAGNPDLTGLDEGFSQYLRLYWMLQELPTDEAIISWNDGTIHDLHGQNWTSGNEFIRTMYSRILYQVAQTNAFLRQTKGMESEEIQNYRAEARFLRALSYYHALDLFGNPPKITADDPVGAFLPPQYTRVELFDFVESELLDIESKIVSANENEYGRADQAAVWFLLAKLYLNAEVYTGTPRYQEVITYTQKIFGANFSLVDDYQKLFLADNDKNGAQKEIIFPIRFDGINTVSYGGMTFIMNAALSGDLADIYGIPDGGWAGLRTTPQFVSLFPGGAESIDEREMFYTEGHTLNIASVSVFTNGYLITKYKNLDSEGNPGQDDLFPDTDFPLFRLADAYLMYAEAVLRGGGGSQTQALAYVNALRDRAYPDDVDGTITANQLTLDFILAERGRELYWEAKRRTDLIRFNQFTVNGIWAWKGNVPQGTTTAAFRNLYPIPASDLGVNTNLTQNPGY